GIGRVTVVGGRGPHLWFAGERGLSLFRDGRFHPVLVEGDETLGTISGLVESTSGDLWLSEAQGVVWIAAGEVAQLLADPAHPVRFRRFDYLDGLPGAPQMNRPAFTVVEAGDGRRWFATDCGRAWVDAVGLGHGRESPPVQGGDGGVGGRPVADGAATA